MLYSTKLTGFVAERDVNGSGGRVRVGQSVAPADGDDQPLACGLHIAYRIVDRVGILDIEILLTVES